MQTLNIDQKYLLNIQEIMNYTGWGETTVRTLLKDPRCEFSVRQGNRHYAIRKKLEKYLDSLAG